jgi:glutathione synthase/RimK-type ligase-like ATP-grasp enzyme
MQLDHPPTPPLTPWHSRGAGSIGYAEIVHRAYAGDDLSALTRDLVARASGPVVDAGALLDLATVLQLQGGDLAVEGKVMQMNALRLQRTYVIQHGSGLGPRILAFVTAGDFMTNTPIDFLLRGSDAVLILRFVDAATQSLDDLPAHDLAFMAIGEAPENAEVLQVMARLLPGLPGPVFNRDVAAVARLDRVSVSAMLAGEPSILAPGTLRLSRDDLAALTLRAENFPLILRPVGSHAGAGLCKIVDPAALTDWLRNTTEAEAHVAPFVDYRSAEGLYTKARVVLICGAPYASHLAQSRHWMVHYLNADMSQNPDRRAAESDWMARFDQDFARRHAQAVAALHRIIGLEYFGIDCAEMPDGRLLIFEVDVAMIVHDMDDATIFPYKKPVMQKLFAGFLAAIKAA